MCYRRLLFKSLSCNKEERSKKKEGKKMKKLIIEVAIPGEDKMATGIRTSGYSNESVSDQLELLGILENVKSIIHDRIKKLADVRTNGGN